WFGRGHSGVLSLTGVLESPTPDCETYLVNPLLENGSILHHLNTFPDTDRRAPIKDVASALKYLHDIGIIYGDLRGCNILIKSDGRACISNFSSARLIDEDALAWPHALPVWSLPWQAPELLQASVWPFTTKATDVHAFGCLLYEVYTSKYPLWEVPGVPRLIAEVCKGRRPLRPFDTDETFGRFGLTDKMWGIMEMCWRVDPQDRPTAGYLFDTV
ncbi:kinase-like protein, partial [Coprinellus micaceus]